MHTSNRTTNILLVVMIAVGFGIVAMLASGVRGGPLAPSGPPASTSSVRLPGTPIDPPSSPASYPIVISAPGHYYLTGNLNPPASTRALTINSSDVSLDLGGFTVTGSGSGPVAGILVFGVQTRVRITNGTVKGFPGNGISAVGITHVVIEDVTVSGTAIGIQVGSYSVVRNCSASENTEYGMLISGSFSTIDNCMVESNGYLGVSLQSGSGHVVKNSTFRNNDTSGLSEGGISFNQVDGSTVRGNDFWANVPVDVLMNSLSDDNVFIGNTFTCPTALTNSGSNNFAPVNTTDPATNRSHRTSC